MTKLIDALGAHSGIVCAVGAGGKKSVLYQLAREHPGRYALTATVHTTVFPDDLSVDPAIDDAAALRERVLSVDKIGYSHRSFLGYHQSLGTGTPQQLRDEPHGDSDHQHRHGNEQEP